MMQVAKLLALGLAAVNAEVVSQSVYALLVTFKTQNATAPSLLFERLKPLARGLLEDEPDYLRNSILLPPTRESDTRVHFLEQWKSARAFDAHQKSHHLAKWRKDAHLYLEGGAYKPSCCNGTRLGNDDQERHPQARYFANRHHTELLETAYHNKTDIVATVVTMKTNSMRDSYSLVGRTELLIRQRLERGRRALRATILMPTEERPDLVRIVHERRTREETEKLLADEHDFFTTGCPLIYDYLSDIAPFLKGHQVVRSKIGGTYDGNLDIERFRAGKHYNKRHLPKLPFLDN